MHGTQEQGQTATVAVDEHVAAAVANEAPQTPAEPLVETELLVEDVSIDGMCGVY